MAHVHRKLYIVGTILLGILLMASVAQAQTRKIAHRSHGGNPNTFAMLMEDDHGGGPVIEPRRRPENYDLEPFIAKIRAHYEHVARQSVKGEDAKANAPDSKSDPNPKEEEPGEKPNKSKPKRAKATQDKSPAPEASTPELPRFHLAKANVSATDGSNANLWLLAAVILACVAPGVVWLSGSRSKQD